MDNLNDLGPLGIGVLMIAVGILVFKWSVTSGMFWKVLQWLLIIGGILLVVNETVGFERIGTAIGAILTWLGRFFSLIGDLLQLAGSAVNRLGD